MLTAENVSYRMNGIHILHDVSVHIPRGRFVGIIGPNGAGKTTLMRVLAGVARPTTGRIDVDGRPLHGMSDRERARIMAYMSQNPAIGFGFTVQDVVAMGRYAHRGPLAPMSTVDREAVEQALAATDVVHLRERPVTDLSGGERQRVFLARTLAQEPRLLFLDEPTSDLDVRFQLEILALIRTLQQEQALTVVMAIHDLTWAARYCDAVLALKSGQVVAFGRTDDVLTESLIDDVFGVRSTIVRTNGAPVRVDFLGTTSSPPLTTRRAVRVD